ncbi:DUF3012 domain-containing protein [Arsukibacterium perlucidum]|uniref:DUF3012 domain-containing protein n=1 Tax=Arsukibacterium perlucidum TaxID=368811 RepID=UPI0009FF9983|nr:DUF3012 domain-containing protein [Arsukibacterium perlucidum]
MKKMLVLLVLSSAMLAGCAPEVGSDRWCKAMEAKDKGDWSANEAADFAKHCLLKIKE